MLVAGLSVGGALFLNFLSSLSAFLGLYVGLILGGIEGVKEWMLAIAAGIFLYLALADLVNFLKSYENYCIKLLSRSAHTHRCLQGGTRERPPPGNRKNCCRNLMLFSKALFFTSNNFRRNSRKIIFQLNFFQKFHNFLKNFPTICFFLLTNEKSTRGF